MAMEGCPFGAHASRGSAQLRGTCKTSPFRLDQVPQVAIQNAKYGNGAIRLLGRFANKHYIAGLIELVVAPEVVGVEEQEHTAAGLVADAGLLLFVGSSRQ